MPLITNLDDKGVSIDDDDAYSTMSEDNAPARGARRNISRSTRPTIDDMNYEDDLDDHEDIDGDMDMNGALFGGKHGSETLLYRISMLRGMIPLSVRVFCYRWYNRATTWVPWAAKKIGNTFWVLITSAFLVGFPIFYEGERDKHLRLMEKEQRLMMPGSASDPQNNRP
jgi:hypothetical protein